jgi:hypothetical protein
MHFSAGCGPPIVLDCIFQRAPFLFHGMTANNRASPQWPLIPAKSKPAPTRPEILFMERNGSSSP